MAWSCLTGGRCRTGVQGCQPHSDSVLLSCPQSLKQAARKPFIPLLFHSLTHWRNCSGVQHQAWHTDGAQYVLNENIPWQIQSSLGAMSCARSGIVMEPYLCSQGTLSDSRGHTAGTSWWCSE